SSSFLCTDPSLQTPTTADPAQSADDGSKNGGGCRGDEHPSLQTPTTADPAQSADDGSKNGGGCRGDEHSFSTISPQRSGFSESQGERELGGENRRLAGLGLEFGRRNRLLGQRRSAGLAVDGKK
ncbi:hypothetical protein LINPERHAP1_LOCUS38264, partial [Linum perenne]